MNIIPARQEAIARFEKKMQVFKDMGVTQTQIALRLGIYSANLHQISQGLYQTSSVLSFCDKLDEIADKLIENAEKIKKI